MADADFTGVLNPKRIIEKRLQSADNPASSPTGNPPVQATPDNARFTKPYTPAERAKQAEALKRFLASRGEN